MAREIFLEPGRLEGPKVFIHFEADVTVEEKEYIFFQKKFNIS